MSGFHEILLIAALAAGILYLPKVMRHRERAATRSESVSGQRGFRIGWALRLAIVTSILWPVLMALHIRPWEGNRMHFVAWGVLPVLVLWGILWIAAARPAGHREDDDQH